MGRGSLVLAAMPGDIGKVRPSLVVQTDAYPETTAVVLLPLTSDLEGPLGPRIEISPGTDNGLRASSRVMIDKITIVRRSKIGPEIGRLTDAEMASINRAMAHFLGIE